MSKYTTFAGTDWGTTGRRDQAFVEYWMYADGLNSADEVYDTLQSQDIGQLADTLLEDMEVDRDDPAEITRDEVCDILSAMRVNLTAGD